MPIFDSGYPNKPVAVAADKILITDSESGDAVSSLEAGDLLASGLPITTDTISEKTAANGVTIDSLNVKDGKLNTNNSVVTNNITDNAVTTVKVADAAITSPKLNISSVKVTLAATFNSSTTQVYQDTGLKITLPTAGTWVIICNLRSGANGANQFGIFRLYNQTTSTGVSDSHTIGGFSSASTIQATNVLSDVVTTTTSNNIIRVELQPGGAYAIPLLADSGGVSRMLAFRIA